MEQKTPTKRRKRRRLRLFVKGEYFDYSLFFIVLFLVCFGLLMIYSSSSYRAVEQGKVSYYFLKRQGIFAGVGLVGMWIASKIEYHFYQYFTIFLYLLAIGLQILVFLMPSSHGAKRWIYIGSFQFQPSEFSKLALILVLAHIISLSVKQVRKLKGLIKILLITAPIFILIAIENMSTSIVIMGIAIIMLFVASPKYKHFIAMGMLAVTAGAIVLIAAPYRVERIAIWLHPEEHDKGLQTMQALYAIGSGGFFGKGLGQSMQKMGFIPESHNDMIFSIICEELGLFGAICIIAMFLMLIWRIMIIANNAPDLYGALICVGIMAQVGVQVIINIAVVTNSIPPTGIPLPFISYGGTSLVLLMGEMGIVLGISRQIKMKH